MKATLAKTQEIRSSRWFKLVWIIPLALALLLVAVLAAQWLRHLPAVQSFITSYPGFSRPRPGTPVGFPGWLGWQHFFNALIILLLIKSGLAVRTTQRPAAFWTRSNDGWLKTKNPPKKISLDLWLHLNLAALLVINGVVCYILLLATGQWKRLVPAHWDVLPNAASAALQYASLDWPAEHGWTNYNALQLLAYFATVFIAAPLAILTGVRMSGAWPTKAKRLNMIYPIELARSVHFPVMMYFVGFIAVHVGLVLATGARRNLNHMFAARDDGSWLGLVFFALALIVIAVAWVGAQPMFLQPLASRTGRLTRR